LGLNLLQQWVAGDVQAMQQRLQAQGVADGAQGHSLLQVSMECCVAGHAGSRVRTCTVWQLDNCLT
jgi:hypothetical protein